MNKVIIFQEIIPHYRIPLFNAIGKDPDISLSVAYDGTTKFNNSADNDFEAVPYANKRIGKFFRIKNIRNLINGYDQIIFIADLRWLPTIVALFFLKGKSKVYFWGIGMSSEQGIRKKPFLDRVRFILSDISSGTILYSKKIAGYYFENVKKKNQIYVAANTISVKRFPFPTNERTKILSIGSFKEYKNLGNLIIAFEQIIDKIPSNITLDFIGDGEEEGKLKAMVQKFGLQNRVIFWGRMESDDEIFKIISHAIVSVSPTQAGLSVLHSMALGCPFLTAEDAITGGERFYIEDNINSYFYDGTIDRLAEKIIWIINNQSINNQVALNAYEFYHNKCSIQNYADSFITIIKNNAN
jgi:glycosyltransferase involved in cell wall biosynthesis